MERRSASQRLITSPTGCLLQSPRSKSRPVMPATTPNFSCLWEFSTRGFARGRGASRTSVDFSPPPLPPSPPPREGAAPPPLPIHPLDIGAQRAEPLVDPLVAP